MIYYAVDSLIERWLVIGQGRAGRETWKMSYEFLDEFYKALIRLQGMYP